MAAFSDADTPATITTVERLSIWLPLLQSAIFPDARVLLSSTETVRQFNWTQFKAGDGEFYLYSESYIKLDPAYATDGTKKLWEFGQEVGNIAIPAGFKS